MKCGSIAISCRGIKLVSLITTLALPKEIFAGPYPKDDLHDTGYSYLQDRSCASYCGAQNQYCCIVGEACFTNQANVAYCSMGAGEPWGGYAVYTTTYTETNLVLRTSTYTSSWVIATPTLQPVPDPAITQAPLCTSSLGESSCGNICCASDQRCAFTNSCTPYTTTLTETTTCPTYKPPFVPTSGDSSTISVTTTVPFQPPATASGSTLPLTPIPSNGDGLSGGAIAGIVIGVILGVALLLLCCGCCVLKSKLLGIGKRKNNSNTGDSSIPEKTSMNKKMILGGLIASILIFLGLRERNRIASTRPTSSRASSSGSSSGGSESSAGSSSSSIDPSDLTDAGNVGRERDIMQRENISRNNI